jgi:hypothetical protein
MKESVAHAVETVWRYMQVDMEPAGADVMIVLGSRGDRVGSYATELTLPRKYGTIVVGGRVS